MDRVPLSRFCKSSDLRNYFQMLGLVPPESPDTVRNEILEYADEVRATLRGEISRLKDEGNSFSLSMDEWTSTAKKSYANINVHVAERTINLGLVRCRDTMPADQWRAMLLKEISSFGLDKADIVGLTTDGSQAMLAMGNKLELMNWNHQLCMAHGLHLAVQDVLYERKSAPSGQEWEEMDVQGSDQDVFDDNDYFAMTYEEPNTKELTENVAFSALINKVRHLIKLFLKNNEGKQLTVIKDVRTRWISTFAMMERYVLLHDSIQKALTDLPSEIHVTDGEVEALNETVRVLGWCRDALTCLCSPSTNLLRSDTILSTLIEQLKSDGSKIGLALSIAVTARFNARRTVASSAMQYIWNGRSNVLHSSIRIHAIEKVEAFIIRLEHRKAADRPTRDGSMCPEPVADKSYAKPIDFMDILKQAVEEQCGSSASTATNPGIVSPREELRLELDLFRRTQRRGRQLESIFERLKLIRATSVEAERDFATAGMSCNKIQSNLADRTIQALSLISSHFRS